MVCPILHRATIITRSKYLCHSEQRWTLQNGNFATERFLEIQHRHQVYHKTNQLKLMYWSITTMMTFV